MLEFGQFFFSPWSKIPHKKTHGISYLYVIEQEEMGILK